MEYVRILTTEEEGELKAKADRDETTITAMLDTKIAQYLEDVKRDNGTAAEVILAKKLAELTPEQRAALAATL